MRRIVFIAAILALAAGIWYVFGHRRPSVQEKLPATMEEFKQRPGGAFTAEAGEFLIGLAKQGKLPGFAAGEHGTMHAGMVDARGNRPSSNTAETYPVSRAIHFSKEGDEADYFYVVVRESPGSTWKLRQACRMDDNGRILENYPVP